MKRPTYARPLLTRAEHDAILETAVAKATYAHNVRTLYTGVVCAVAGLFVGVVAVIGAIVLLG